MPHLMMFAFSLVAPIATCALTVVSGHYGLPRRRPRQFATQRTAHLPFCKGTPLVAVNARSPPRVRIAGRRLVARVWSPRSLARHYRLAAGVRRLRCRLLSRWGNKHCLHGGHRGVPTTDFRFSIDGRRLSASYPRWQTAVS